MKTARAVTSRYGWCLVLVCGLMALGAGSTSAQDGADEPRILLLQSKPKASSIVKASGREASPRARLAAIEAAEHAPEIAFDLARAGLSDENPAVRFAALVIVGKLKLADLADAAMDLVDDENESVRAAALFAANRCGKGVNLSPLAGMLASGSGGVRANVAMLIGQLGDPQAIDMLRDMASKPMTRISSAERTWVRLQYAEAMVRLDPEDAEVLGTIRASVYSNIDAVRILAIMILGEVGDRSVQGGLMHIIDRDNPIQVKIAAAQSLARMGDRQAGGVLIQASRYDERQLVQDLTAYLKNSQATGPEAQAIRELLKDERGRVRAAAEVRAQAAVGLGFVDTTASAKRLAVLLDDVDSIVQVAAASAILRALR